MIERVTKIVVPTILLAWGIFILSEAVFLKKETPKVYNDTKVVHTYVSTSDSPTNDWTLVTQGNAAYTTLNGTVGVTIYVYSPDGEFECKDSNGYIEIRKVSK